MEAVQGAYCFIKYIGFFQEIHLKNKPKIKWKWVYLARISQNIAVQHIAFMLNHFSHSCNSEKHII